MADVTTVDVSVLVATAARCEEGAGRLRALLSGLLDRLEERRAAWRGGGGTAFEEVRRAWAGDQEALVGALAETAAMLRATAARYTATDERAARRIAAAGLAAPDEDTSQRDVSAGCPLPDGGADRWPAPATGQPVSGGVGVPVASVRPRVEAQ